MYKAAAKAQRNHHIVYDSNHKVVMPSTTDKDSVNAFIKKNEGKGYVIESETEIDPLSHALQNFDTTINSILRKLNPVEYELFLSGEDNYRNEIATIKPYKGNRDKMAKPYYLEEVYDHAVRNWGAYICEGEEAEDRIGILNAQSPGKYIIAHIDKDLNQLPGYHYNFDTEDFYKVSPEEGMFFLYCQIVAGDSTDNIQGIMGVGLKTAAKILAGETGNELGLYKLALAAYKEAGLGEKELIENARLVRIRQKDNELWLPPCELKS